MAVLSVPSPYTNTQKGKMTSRSHSGLVAQPGQELARPDSHWEHQIFLNSRGMFVHICTCKSGCILQMDGPVSEW